MDPNVVGNDDADSTELSSRRFRKVVDGFAAKWQMWGAADPFMDHTIPETVDSSPSPTNTVRFPICFCA